jgi:hypothetical protein
VPMKKLAFIVLTPSLLISCITSHGRTEVDGNMLLNNCLEAIKYIDNKNDPTINISAANYCVGYISGINDLHAYFVSSISCFDPPKYCLPQETNSEQLVKIIVKFFKTHLEDLQFQGSDLVIVALKEAFPCPSNTRHK